MRTPVAGHLLLLGEDEKDRGGARAPKEHFPLRDERVARRRRFYLPGREGGPTFCLSRGEGSLPPATRLTVHWTDGSLEKACRSVYHRPALVRLTSRNRKAPE